METDNLKQLHSDINVYKNTIITLRQQLEIVHSESQQNIQRVEQSHRQEIIDLKNTLSLLREQIEDNKNTDSHLLEKIKSESAKETRQLQAMIRQQRETLEQFTREKENNNQALLARHYSETNVLKNTIIALRERLNEHE